MAQGTQPDWKIDQIKDYQVICWDTQPNGEQKIKAITDSLINATLFVGINKISKKNTKLFNKRLKILKFAGLPIFNEVRILDIENHIGLTTTAKKMSPSEFKSIVWSSMEEGAEILIDEEARITAQPKPIQDEVLDAKESDEEEVTLVPDL
jgi:hypothetical protein